jgi:mannosyltransferase OCH1-like enzyme
MPSTFEIDMVLEKLKRHNSQGIDQISTQLIKAGVPKICPDIQKLIHSIWNKEKLPEYWKQSIVHIYRKGDNTL